MPLVKRINSRNERLGKDINAQNNCQRIDNSKYGVYKRGVQKEVIVLANKEILIETSSREIARGKFQKMAVEKLYDESLAVVVTNYVFGNESVSQDFNQENQERYSLMSKVSDLLGSDLSERRDQGVMALLLATEAKIAMHDRTKVNK